MRVIAGEWKSRRITAPHSEGVRPTTDRVRESVFDILENILDFSECTVLDLFAGSGAMGIEALSRGARHAAFVEQSRATAKILKENVVSLGCSASTCEIIVADALKFVRRASGPADVVDIIFADPPYRYPEIEQCTETIILNNLFRRVFVAEHSSAIELHPPQLKPWAHKKFGTTAVTIFRKHD